MRTFFLLCVISLCSALSWGQTWNLTATMSATLNNGVLTVTTTANAEAMPDYHIVNSLPPPWYDVRNNIRSVVIGDGITTIGVVAFGLCESLTSVTFPNSVTTIGASAFSGSGLTSVTFPNSVTTIGEDVFFGCKSLTSVVLSNSLTTIGGQAFLGCTSLTSITIPNSVTTIGVSAFTLCESLTSITMIPGSVTEIGSEAFAYCKSLETVTIPNSVKTIGEYAFYGCSALKTVSVAWSLPLSVPENIFYGSDNLGYINWSVATLRVPVGTKEYYKVSPVWSLFQNIVEYDAVGIEQVASQTLKAYASNGLLYITGLQSGQPLSIYSLSGQLVYQGIAKAADEYVSLAVRGVYIVVAGEQKVKVMNN